MMKRAHPSPCPFAAYAPAVCAAPPNRTSRARRRQPPAPRSVSVPAAPHRRMLPGAGARRAPRAPRRPAQKPRPAARRSAARARPERRRSRKLPAYMTRRSSPLRALRRPAGKMIGPDLRTPIKLRKLRPKHRAWPHWSLQPKSLHLYEMSAILRLMHVNATLFLRNFAQCAVRWALFSNDSCQHLRDDLT